MSPRYLEFDVHILVGETRPWLRVMDTHGNFWAERIDLDIPPAAFFTIDPEPTTPIKPSDETIKPTKTEPIKPEPDTTEKPTEPEPDKERNITAKRKRIVLWAKLKWEWSSVHYTPTTPAVHSHCLLHWRFLV